MDPEQVARTQLDGRPIQVTVTGETLEILPEEVEARVTAGSDGCLRRRLPVCLED